MFLIVVEKKNCLRDFIFDKNDNVTPLIRNDLVFDAKIAIRGKLAPTRGGTQGDHPYTSLSHRFDERIKQMLTPHVYSMSHSESSFSAQIDTLNSTGEHAESKLMSRTLKQNFHGYR